MARRTASAGGGEARRPLGTCAPRPALSQFLFFSTEFSPGDRERVSAFSDDLDVRTGAAPTLHPALAGSVRVSQ